MISKGLGFRISLISKGVSQWLPLIFQSVWAQSHAFLSKVSMAFSFGEKASQDLVMVSKTMRDLDFSNIMAQELSFEGSFTEN